MVVVMNRTNILICTICYLFLATLVVEGYVGMNWGRMATHRLIPSMVVDLLLQNGINDVKLFSASDNVLEAFAGTGIHVSITMPNVAIKYLNTTEIAQQWIDKNVIPFLKMNVTLRYIYMGTEPLSKRFFNQTEDNVISAMDLVQKGLDGNNMTANIKAIVSHYIDILNLPLTKPSMAEFRPDLKDLLFTYLSQLKRSNAPLVFGYCPLIAVQENFKNDTEFAFFENNSTSKFQDGNFTYSNVFEVVYDSMVFALEKMGFPDFPVIVGTLGWPTDGIEGGNLQNAERFHQGLVKFARMKKGTPKRPGNDIDIYIHSITDENAVSVNAGPYLRHWGIYKFDGQPKFNLDFTGLEREILPASGLGITHMPKRWCILDVSRMKLDQIPFETLDKFYNSSCQDADCTAMSPGGSCSFLPFPLNYSYGFNMGFQYNKQSLQGLNSCDYGGYGVIVQDDPSTPTCSFPVEIVAAETTNFLGQGTSQGSAAPVAACYFLSITVIVQLLFILFNFI